MRRRILVGTLSFVGLVSLIPHARPYAGPVAGAYRDECPSGHIEAAGSCCGAKCKFTGAVSGWFAGVEPVVKWEVSGGKIVRGQGTWYIKVAPDKARGKPITVTL